MKDGVTQLASASWLTPDGSTIYSTRPKVMSPASISSSLTSLMLFASSAAHREVVQG